MLLYLLLFFITIILYKTALSSKGKFRYFFLLLSAVVPSLLAAFRDSDIGRDVGLYVLPIWQNAVNSHSFLAFYRNDSFGAELFYLSFNYIVSRVSDSFNFFLFCHEFLMMSLIIGAAYMYRNKYNSSYVLSFYLFYLFNETLSMMRQGIAVCFSVLACAYLFKSKWKKAYISLFFTIISHNSAVLALLILPIHKMANKLNNKRLILMVGVTAATMFLYKFYQIAVQYLIEVGVASIKYEMYLDQDGYTTHKIDLLFLISILCIQYIGVNKYNRNIGIFNNVLTFTAIALALTFLGGVTEIANRIAYYFVAPLFVLLPLISNAKAEQKRIVYFALLMLLVRFVYLGVTTGIADTIPYSSKILGI